jgi:hypothetical protein
VICPVHNVVGGEIVTLSLFDAFDVLWQVADPSDQMAVLDLKKSNPDEFLASAEKAPRILRMIFSPSSGPPAAGRNPAGISTGAINHICNLRVHQKRVSPNTHRL